MSWLDYSGCTRHGQLVSETQQRITKLQQAIANIQTVRKHLKRNAAEVKSEINDVVSRQLETLRTREVWLLSQVEIIEQAKEEVLRGQQDRLCHLLGGLQTHLEYNTEQQDPTTSSSPASLDRKLSSSLEQLDSLDLRAQESPHLSFQADALQLRDSILKFGRVEGKPSGLLGKAFASPDTPSTSLPPSWEEYGDGDHHVLYKTLEEISFSKNIAPSIQVKIPKIPNVAEWLSYDPSEEQPVPTVPSARNSLTGLEGALGTADRSIKHWLKQIKQHVEEEDYDMIQPLHHSRYVSGSSESIELIQESEIKEIAMEESGDMSPMTYPVFTDVMAEPAQKWLKLATAEATAEIPSFDIFDKNFQDVSKWLQKKGEDACCSGQCSPDMPVNVDIENLDTMLCMMKGLKSHSQDRDGKAWLSTQEERDVDETYAIMTKVCRANELCDSFSECVCDESCKTLLENESDYKQETEAPKFHYFQMVMSELDDRWLSPIKATQCAEPTVAFPVFQKNSSCWLMKQVTPMEVDAAIFQPERNPHKTNWLSTTNSPATTNQCLNFSHTPCDSLWLSSANLEVQCPDWGAVCRANPAAYLPNNPWLHPTRQRHTPPSKPQPIKLEDVSFWLTALKEKDMIDKPEASEKPVQNFNKETTLGFEKLSLKRAYMEDEEDDFTWLMRKESKSSSPPDAEDFTVLFHKVALAGNWLADSNKQQ